MNQETIERIREFRTVLRKFERELYFQNVASCCNGVTLPQCHALLEIEDNPHISMTDLAGKLSLEKSTVSRTIDQLVKKGLVDREIPGENRRTIKLALTKHGEKTCKTINWNNDAYFAEVLLCLNDGERQDFIRYFIEVTKKLATMRTDLSTC